VQRPAKLGPIEAFEVIQKLLAEGDTIGLSSHARAQCAARHVTVDDIRNVLQRGTVSPHAEWNDKTQNWKYSVTGVDCERDPLVVVVALEPWICRITTITVKGA